MNSEFMNMTDDEWNIYFKYLSYYIFYNYNGYFNNTSEFNNIDKVINEDMELYKKFNELNGAIYDDLDNNELKSMKIKSVCLAFIICAYIKLFDPMNYILDTTNIETSYYNTNDVIIKKTNSSNNMSSFVFENFYEY